MNFTIENKGCHIRSDRMAGEGANRREADQNKRQKIKMWRLLNYIRE